MRTVTNHSTDCCIHRTLRTAEWLTTCYEKTLSCNSHVVTMKVDSSCAKLSRVVHKGARESFSGAGANCSDITPAVVARLLLLHSRFTVNDRATDAVAQPFDPANRLIAPSRFHDIC